MKILILRVSAIGDVIHTLPAVFFIKKYCPSAQISWVIQEKAANIILNQPFIENVFVLRDKFLHPKNVLHTFKTIQEIKKTKWDVILDFQGILKTSILLYFLPGLKIGFDKLNARSSISTLFTDIKTSPEFKNIIQKNLCLADRCVQQFKSTTNCPTLDELKKCFKLTISSQDQQVIETWLSTNNIKKFVLLCPNTTWETKHWPEENWLEFIKLFLDAKQPFDLVLVGQNFGVAAKNIANFIQHSNLQIKIAPDFNLCQTAHLISKAGLVIAPDTGLLHLADFLDTQSIGIFGPTNKNLLGAFLNCKNVHNAIQVYAPNQWNLKKTTQSGNQMYKLTSRMMLEKVLATLSNSKN